MIVADLLIGYNMVRERFTSRVMLEPARPHRCQLQRRPVPLSQQSLAVRAAADGQCLIDFYVDFEFRSRMLQKIMEMLFNEAVKRMVGAFEARAHQLYGEAKT